MYRSAVGERGFVFEEEIRLGIRLKTKAEEGQKEKHSGDHFSRVWEIILAGMLSVHNIYFSTDSPVLIGSGRLFAVVSITGIVSVVVFCSAGASTAAGSAAFSSTLVSLLLQPMKKAVVSMRVIAQRNGLNFLMFNCIFYYFKDKHTDIFYNSVIFNE